MRHPTETPSTLFALALLVAGLWAAMPGVARAEVLGLATQVRGDVTVRSPMPGADDSVAIPRTLDPLPAGSVVRVKAGGRMEILCSTDHLVVLVGPVRWSLEGQSCRKGRHQGSGAFRRLQPERGRITLVDGMTIQEIDTRFKIAAGAHAGGYSSSRPAGRGGGRPSSSRRDAGGGTGPAPVLLAPRNSALRDGSPEIVWTAVPGAVEYQIEVRGGAGFGQHRQTVSPLQASCGSRRGGWASVEVCTFPFAGLGAGAVPEDRIDLTVGARHATGAEPRREALPSQIRSLSESRSTTLDRALGELPARQEFPFVHDLLMARLLADHELYEAARRILHRALAGREAAALRVTLADLYMEIGLAAQAERHYRRVLDGSASPAARGSAAFNLGRIEESRDSSFRAREYYEAAYELFGRAGLPGERRAALRAAKRARWGR